MDEITFMYNAWRTCLEMAEDRKYIINNNYKQLSINDFRYLLLNKDHSTDIICDENSADPSKILYIKFIGAEKFVFICCCSGQFCSRLLLLR